MMIVIWTIRIIIYFKIITIITTMIHQNCINEKIIIQKKILIKSMTWITK